MMGLFTRKKNVTEWLHDAVRGDFRSTKVDPAKVGAAAALSSVIVTITTAKAVDSAEKVSRDTVEATYDHGKQEK